MAIEVTPKGTRGKEFSEPTRLIVRAMRILTAAAYRLFGSRMQMEGLPFLILDTVGAKTGKRRRALVPCR